MCVVGDEVTEVGKDFILMGLEYLDGGGWTLCFENSGERWIV